MTRRWRVSAVRPIPSSGSAAAARPRIGCMSPFMPKRGGPWTPSTAPRLPPAQRTMARQATGRATQKTTMRPTCSTRTVTMSRRSAGSPPESPRVLGQPVLDLVVIALVGDEDVLFDVGARGRFEGAHGDRDRVLFDRVPEQRGAAGRAEPALDLVRGAEPGDVELAIDLERLARHVGGHPVVAGSLPALGAVAGVRRLQLALDLEFHGSAKAGSGVHGAFLASAASF